VLLRADDGALPVAFRLGALLALVGGALVVSLFDPHLGFQPLARSLQRQLHDDPEAEPPRVQLGAVSVTPAGLRARAELGFARVEWLGGHIVRSTDRQYRHQLLRLPVLYVLVQAFRGASRDAGPCGVAPGVGHDLDLWRSMDPDGQPWMPYRSSSEPLAAFVAGSDAVSRLGIHRLVHTEALQQIPLAPGGVLALWFSPADMKPVDVARLLSTIEAAGLESHVFLRGREAVLIAGKDLPGLNLDALANAFEHDAVSPHLTASGLLHPAELLACYVGNLDDLRSLWNSTAPQRAVAPLPGMSPGRDLARPADPAGLLAVAQYRALGAGRISELLAQDPRGARMRVMLHGYEDLYNTRTRAELLHIGAAVQAGGDRAKERLLAALGGEYIRLGMLAPGYKDAVLKQAYVMDLMGLHGSAADMLEAHLEKGVDSGEARLLLGRQYERLADWRKALQQYRKAVRLAPESDAARKSAERVEARLRPQRRLPQLPDGGGR
jgi:tetratricopeptide (TPR) repeat protein